jgi:major membrane immunogen (membrane-anchored lipoprotein)
MMILISVVLLSACGKSDFEKSAEKIRNTKVTVDKDVYEQTKNKIQETYDDLTHK